MGRKRNPVAVWFKTSTVLVFLRCTQLIPLAIARGIGRRMGHIAYYLLPRVQSVGMKNLDLAYGDSKTKKEKQAILIESMEGLGTLAGEFAHLPLTRNEGKEKLFRVIGLEHVANSEGGIMIGAHLGNWEWMAGAIGTLNFKIVGVVRPLDDPRLNDAILELRGDTGVEVIGKKNAGAELIKAVRNGHIAGLLIDQSARKNAVPVTFFGQPCWATIGPIMVALRTKKPLFPMSMTRDKDGFYTLEFYEPIYIERSGNIHEDLVNGSQVCQDFIEKLVRAHPSQWMWIHKRWKKQPNLEVEWEKRINRG